jgi:acetyl-CoA acetyltransferase
MLSSAFCSSASGPRSCMSITVGWNTAQLAGISPEEMDAWALRSHLRAVGAIDEGRFAAEIVPLKVRAAAAAEIGFDTDEHPPGTPPWSG